MNRQLVDEGAVDSNLQSVFQDVMQKGNTFGESQSARGDWADELDDLEIDDAREHEVEYLWYVGDYPSFDDRNKKVARALARLFDEADVSFGILFDDEKTDGNDIRRIGEEFLYLELAGPTTSRRSRTASSTRSSVRTRTRTTRSKTSTPRSTSRSSPTTR